MKVTIDLPDVSVVLDMLDSAASWFEFAAREYQDDEDKDGLEEAELHALACGQLYIELRNAWLGIKEPA